jgi:uncharacterized protein with PQ loop repeat
VTTISASALLAFFAALIGVTFAVVQIARTLRTGSVEGVALLSWVAMTANAGLWTVYGVTTGSVQQILANGPWVLATVVLGSYLADSRGLPASVGALAGLLGLPLGFVVNQIGDAGVTVLGVLLILGVGVPQIAVLRRSAGAEGVSLLGWVLASVSATCWLVHGLVEARPAVYLCSTLGLAVNVTVTISLIGARRRGRTTSGSFDDVTAAVPVGAAQ